MYDNLAQPWQQATAPQMRLPIKSNVLFYLMHHPKNWDLIEVMRKNAKKPRFYWLPNLNRLICEAGVNNVRGTKSRPDTTYARAEFVEKGYTILDPAQHDYLRIYPAHMGKFHALKWQNYEMLGGELIKTTDRNGYADFKRQLVANGIIDLPHPEILKRIIIKQSELINMHASKPHIPAAVAAKEAAVIKLEHMQAAADAITKNGVSAYE